jgi:hypothetical protein
MDARRTAHIVRAFDALTRYDIAQHFSAAYL